MSKIAFIFPGQGSQRVGMGKDFYNNFISSKRVFDEADEILGYKLSDIIFNGPKEKLNLTKNAQLALFVNSVAILMAIRETFPNLKPSVCAGLSLGEYSALFAAKKISFKEALLLLQKRADYMSEACKNTNGIMAAIIGLKREQIEDVIKNFENVYLANLNTPLQTVISGKKEDIEKMCALLKEKGAKRAILLDVEGAFHSPLMKDAEEKIKKDIESTNFLNSDIEIVMNATSDFTLDVEIIKRFLIKQITSSVKWEESIKKIDDKVDLFIEIGSGKALSGMNKKMDLKAKTISIEKTSDLKIFKKEFLENVKK